MRVLQIYKDYFPPVVGGIEGHINFLTNGLKNLGIEAEVLVSNTKRKSVRETIDGIKVSKVSQIGRISSAPVNVGFPFWLRRLGSAPDILHFHFPNPTAEFSYLLAGLKKKVVVTYHSDIVRQVALKRFYFPFMHVFLRKSSKIIATSNNYIRSSEVLSRYRHKCEVVPLGVDLNRFRLRSEDEDLVQSLRSKYGTPIILFAGKLRYYKGLHVLIDAMKKVRNGKLLIIGRGPLGHELRRQAADLNGKILFLGEVPDQELVLHYHASDVSVLPSIFRSEAFGIVQLEAMACGKPVISTELGTGTSYVNQHGRTGMVVPPKDPDGLAEAINFILDNKEIRLEYGMAARDRIEKYFSLDAMVKNTVRIYESLLN